MTNEIGESMKSAAFTMLSGLGASRSVVIRLEDRPAALNLVIEATHSDRWLRRSRDFRLPAGASAITFEGTATAAVKFLELVWPMLAERKSAGFAARSKEAVE